MRRNKALTATTLVDKAEDLDALRNAVVDAANVSTGLWLSYLFVLFYFAIAAGGVTHRDLFFENPVKLPFLNVDLPLVAFFVLAPALFLIVHAYVLLQVALLAGKVGVFDVQLLQAQIKDPAVQADALRRQLPSNIFVQLLAGPSDVRTGVMGRMLRLVAQISLAVGPVALLVLFQLQFLPFHRWEITWWHRIAVVLDIALLWTLWPSIARGATSWIAWRDLRQRWVAGIAVASFAPVLLVFTLATYPGEWLDAMPSVPFVPTKWPQSKPEVTLSKGSAAAPCAPGTGDTENTVEPTDAEIKGEFQRLVALVKSMGWSSLYTLVIAGDVNPTTRHPTSLWPNSNRLVLPGFDVMDQAKFDTEQKIENVSHTASLRGRYLEGAVLCGANLRKVDFTGARLRGALLNDARLQGALLDDANLQDAKLNKASLQGASLARAELQRAELNSASLQGAWLNNAELQGALFNSAGLQGASLINSKLHDASFQLAQLQAVAFDGAELEGASFNLANLQGASLGGAHLEGAILTSTSVWRVDVRERSEVHLRDAKLEPCWSTNDGPFCQEATFSSDKFNALKQLIKTQVPSGDLQRRALDRIQGLDPDKPLEGEAEMAQAWIDLAKRRDGPPQR
jgi:uncharacterized protein YjbI with pentapeptide repeats